MNTIPIKMVCLLCGYVLMLGGCHPQALYKEPSLPPIEQGRNSEQHHRYAEAEEHYLQVDNIEIQEMTLNQLASAWDSVNAGIVRAQEAVNQQPREAKSRLRLAEEYYKKGLLCTRYTTGVVGEYPRDFVFDQQEYYYREALRQAQKARQLQPDLYDTYLLIGEIHLANLRHNEALNELKRLIAKNPGYARGYYAIGKIYLAMQAYDKVERYLIRTIKLDPDFIDAYYLLGQFYLEKGWYDYAAFTFLETLRKNPSDGPTLDLLIESYHELGNYYVDQEDYDHAIQIFNEILKVRSSHAVYQSLLQARQKRKEAALKAEAARQEAAEAALQAAQEAQQKAAMKAQEAAAKPAEAITREQEASEPVSAPPVLEPPPPLPEQGEEEMTEMPPKEVVVTQLRNTPAALSSNDIVLMIQTQGFHHPNNMSNFGLSGSVEGNFQHEYEEQSLNDDPVVLDHVSGLMWQQAGSPEQQTWDEAKAYLQQLNQAAYAGHTDWRLPTAEELASLLEFEKKNGNVYIAPVFDATLGICWTADTVSTSNAVWAVAFQSGHIYYDEVDRTNYVRAVR